MFDRGIIILDKPYGHTSHEITSYVKKLFGVKTGHAGTLDPDVSGVLPIALGKDTKMLRFVAQKDKTYVGIIKFKEIVEKETIEKIFKDFTGKISQIPPKMSAVKKVKRTREVFELSLIETDGKKSLFRAKVSAGTYIRTLCVDIGKKLKIPAKMDELRRISVGDITENESTKINDLIDAVWLYKNKNDDSLLKKIIKPVDNFLNYKKIIIKTSAANSLRSGAQLMAPGIISADETIKKDEIILIYSQDNFLIGIGISLFFGNEIKNIKHGQVVKTERIY